jgi:general secretion pathway protein G
MRNGRRGARGFTLLELLVVLAIIGTLLSLAAPRYFRSMEKAREAVLRENLGAIRATLDRFYADNGVYPASLDELVARRYLRQVPEDPLTGSATTWQVRSAAGAAQAVVADVRSGAPGKDHDGVAYREW